MITLIAYMILTNPDPRAVETQYPPEITKQLGAEILRIAVDLEVVETRDSYWYFQREDNYLLDVSILREYYQRVRSTPKLWQANAFKCRSYDYDGVIESLHRQRDRLDKLYLCHSMSFEYYDDYRDEINYQILIYKTARDATGSYYSAVVRREALEKLRVELGDKNFNQGIIP